MEIQLLKYQNMQYKNMIKSVIKLLEVLYDYYFIIFFIFFHTKRLVTIIMNMKHY